MRTSIATIALAIAAALPSQTPPDPGSELTISLVTMGHGDQVWEMFGHNAIWIHDATHGTDALYNWGVFDFREPHFIPHFLQGRNLYSMAGYGLDETMAQYRSQNRSVVTQELNLTPAQRLAVRNFIEWNARPENVHYRYDYFLDNCSTRVRDLLDKVLGGQIKAVATKRMTGTTYRWHALRLMQADKPLVTGVDIGIGRPGDHELSAWEAMFLPEQVRQFVKTLQVADGKGGTMPLVKNERVLFQADRSPEGTQPPNLGLLLTPLGLVIAALIVVVGQRGATGRRQARLAAAVVIGVWSLVAGLLGLILTALWTVTDHVATYQNENLLLFNPIWIVLAVTIPLFYARGVAIRQTRFLALAAGALSSVALLMHVVTLSAQSNLPLIGLALPPALAVAWVATRPVAHVRA